MSKKKFTDGLESLFGDNTSFEKESPLLVTTEEEVTEEKPKSVAPKRKSKRGGKSFTSDLDTLFSEVVQEIENDYLAKAKKVDKPQQQSKKKVRKPVSGLDALIRSTVGSSKEHNLSYETRKRISFTFDKIKIEKLKKIAKTEKAYLKDIVGKLIEEYIAEYEDSKGAGAN